MNLLTRKQFHAMVRKSLNLPKTKKLLVDLIKSTAEIVAREKKRHK